MFNELVRLRDVPDLQQLLSHYVEAAVAAPGLWQDRVMHLKGVEPRTLAKLHGELLAHDWIEQNTGHTSFPPATEYRCCYRATEAGIRALKQVFGGLVGSEDVIAGIAARTIAKRTIYRETRSRKRTRRGKR
jgi:hypothetical protein